jgi:hypothetical protein
MLNMFLSIGLVVAALSIPLVFYWKADEIARFLRRYGV